MKRYETPTISESDAVGQTSIVKTFTQGVSYWISHLLSFRMKRDRIQIAGLTDRGARYRNEDRIYISKAIWGLVLATACDGMGGEVAGDLAAKICVNTFKKHFASARRLEQWLKEKGFRKSDPLPILSRLMEEANSEIRLRSPDSVIVGTTCTAALIQDKENSNILYWAHVGDSRLYLVREQNVRQLTSDHTWIQDQLDRGLLTASQAAEHPKRHHLANFLGMDGGLHIETGEERLILGDMIIICTDGISNEIPAEQIGDIVFQASPENASTKLIATAKQQGGSMVDNMSIIVVKIGDL